MYTYYLGIDIKCNDDLAHPVRQHGEIENCEADSIGRLKYLHLKFLCLIQNETFL